jgi:hypothetical protein
MTKFYSDRDDELSRGGRFRRVSKRKPFLEWIVCSLVLFGISFQCAASDGGPEIVIQGDVAVAIVAVTARAREMGLDPRECRFNIVTTPSSVVVYLRLRGTEFGVTGSVGPRGILFVKVAKSTGEVIDAHYLK